MNKVYIVYPSGAHGSFLNLLLNVMTGSIAENAFDFFVYDNVKFKNYTNFSHCHSIIQINEPYECIVNIRVRPTSYLKYSALSINRTASRDIILENLADNVFEKLKTHSIFKNFYKSLIEISGKSSGDIELKYLREWARLCLFANHGATITEWVKYSVVDNSYQLDFESFYNGTIIQQCKKILQYVGLKEVDVDLTPYLTHFEQHNRYRSIDQNVNLVIEHIKQRQYMPIESGNFLVEAWLDNWLVETYNINPLLQNEYFSNTQQIINHYLD